LQYARSEDWTVLSDALAARLDAANETHSATLCYICSGNIEKAAEIWSRSLQTVRGSNYVEALQVSLSAAAALRLRWGLDHT
jgi:protein transport protein SEC31